MGRNTSAAQCSVCKEWKHPYESFVKAPWGDKIPRVCLDCDEKAH